MIQRIQSIYLLLAFILDGSIFFNSLYTHAMNDPQQWIGWGFTIVLILAGLLSLGCIFLYSNRDNQARGTGAALLLQIIALGFGVGILISLGGFGSFLWDETIGAVLLLISLVFVYMARNKIYADIALVKSMDRIR